jgi:DNA primase
MAQTLGFIDFAAVKAAVSLEQVLEHYGVLATLKPHGEKNLRGCCPIHKGDDPKQFSVTLEKNAWNCFSQCKHGGNMLEFVMQMEDCSSLAAAWKVNDWFNLGQEKKAAERVRTQPAERREAPAANAPAHTASATTPREYPKASKASAVAATPEPELETGFNKVLDFTLENLDATHPYLKGRGLSAETLAHFGIGYCPKGIMAGRIAIPIHNTDGQVVGNAGRWPGEPDEGKEKYRLPGKFKKTLEVFNYHRAALESADTPLVIVEGFFPVMHLWQHGIRRVVAFMGWSMSERQEELIAKLVTPESKIILMLDNDAAGIEARQKIAPRLAEHCFVRSFRWPEGIHQPDELTEEHLETLRA